MTSSLHSLRVACAVACVLLSSNALASPDHAGVPRDIKLDKVETAVDRGAASEGKLDMQLRLLTNQFNRTRGKSGPTLREGELVSIFNIHASDKNPLVEVGIKTKDGTKGDELEKAGAKISFDMDGIFYATLPVDALTRVAQLNDVEAIYTIRKAEIPLPPKEKEPLAKAPTEAATAAPRAGKSSLTGTGKNVIVGVVDSGIDWKHPDFIKADGTSRILYLYDMSDNSWTKSGGTIGSTPPGYYNRGTVYTNQQINDALAGKGTCNSYDQIGHGTACAGVAAGNGRATSGDIPAGTYVGVAPEADLIVVRLGTSGRGFTDSYLPGVRFITSKAKELGRPCAINLSLGSQGSAHDGLTGEEQMLNAFVGAGKPGVAVCVAAGNERDMSFHAGGRFGPNRPEQADMYSSDIELVVSQPTRMYAYFDRADDWGLGLIGSDNFLVAGEKKPVLGMIEKRGTSLYSIALVDNKKYEGPIAPGQTTTFGDYLRDSVGFVEKVPNEVSVDLPPGRYTVFAYGPTETVSKGRFDLYLPDVMSASFAKGNEQKFMVGTPGNAKNVITVGAYDFQDKWKNLTGSDTYYNLPIGDISDYSCPGYSRDGSVKPEIAAPATYAISSLGRLLDGGYCDMGAKKADNNKEPNPKKVTRDGYHIAWSGTSAATPYVVGVITLMLEKNPNLDGEQIKTILTKTGTHDALTGGVPNRDWGYGKINLEAAVRATPKSRTEASGP